MESSKGAGHEVAVLGGGCFWCTDAVFSELAGVLRVEPGYAGGTRPHPSYEEVCEGSTGHAEVVRVEFDPQALPYADLLRVFFAIHDPTTPNRQGPDVGTQYRSIILTTTPEQTATARDVLREVDNARLWRHPLVTEVQPLREFWPAEEYHHRYFERNPSQAYCRLVIEPKVAKFRKQFLAKLARPSAGRQ